MVHVFKVYVIEIYILSVSYVFNVCYSFDYIHLSKLPRFAHLFQM